MVENKIKELCESVFDEISKGANDSESSFHAWYYFSDEELEGTNVIIHYVWNNIVDKVTDDEINTYIESEKTPIRFSDLKVRIGDKENADNPISLVTITNMLKRGVVASSIIDKIRSIILGNKGKGIWNISNLYN